MSYFVIEDFRSGLDLRRPGLVAPAGTLAKLTNAHLTAGGDIEKRYSFVEVATAPAGSFGLAAIGSTLYVFKQTAALEAPPLAEEIPNSRALEGQARAVSIQTINIVMPAGKTAVRLTDWDLFNGLIYSVVQADDGDYYHFYGENYVSQINALYSPAPYNVRTFKSKIYAITRDRLVFCAIDNPLIWDPDDAAGTGQGFIYTQNSGGNADVLLGLEIYYDQLAVASRYSTQIWEVDANPDNNNLRQTLRGAGTVAPPTMLQYGSGDVLYLHDSGIRSLRAKDSSNAAAVSDIGSPIDPVIQNLIKARPNDPYILQAFSLVEPNTGRFWMCFKDRIFVLSYYPGPKVTAWSEYVPEMPIDAGVVAEGQIAFRSGDKIYFHGGLSGMFYDDCEVTVEVPPLSVGKPATVKGFTAIDLAAWGEWTVTAGFDPNRQDVRDSVCAVSAPSFGLQGSIALQGVSTHVSLLLKNKANGPAMLSAIAVHYVSNEKAD